MTKMQFITLWFSVFYFAIVLVVIGSRAAWGFLRLGSEYRESLVPREALLEVADSAARDFHLHTILVAVGFAMLGIVAVWLTKSPQVEPK